VERGGVSQLQFSSLSLLRKDVNEGTLDVQRCQLPDLSLMAAYTWYNPGIPVSVLLVLAFLLLFIYAKKKSNSCGFFALSFQSLCSDLQMQKHFLNLQMQHILTWINNEP